RTPIATPFPSTTVFRSLVGLLEVLGGEQQGAAPVDQLADHGPQVDAAAGVEAGGGLVEEQHRRFGHQRARQVEPAAHAARVGLEDRKSTRLNSSHVKIS